MFRERNHRQVATKLEGISLIHSRKTSCWSCLLIGVRWSILDNPWWWTVVVQPSRIILASLSLSLPACLMPELFFSMDVKTLKTNWGSFAQMQTCQAGITHVHTISDHSILIVVWKAAHLNSVQRFLKDTILTQIFWWTPFINNTQQR